MATDTLCKKARDLLASGRKKFSIIDVAEALADELGIEVSAAQKRIYRMKDSGKIVPLVFGGSYWITLGDTEDILKGVDRSWE